MPCGEPVAESRLRIRKSGRGLACCSSRVVSGNSSSRRQRARLPIWSDSRAEFPTPRASPNQHRHQSNVDDDGKAPRRDARWISSRYGGPETGGVTPSNSQTHARRRSHPRPCIRDAAAGISVFVQSDLLIVDWSHTLGGVLFSSFRPCSIRYSTITFIFSPTREGDERSACLPITRMRANRG
jgi:hypothetical protein